MRTSFGACPGPDDSTSSLFNMFDDTSNEEEEVDKDKEYVYEDGVM